MIIWQAWEQRAWTPAPVRPGDAVPAAMRNGTALAYAPRRVTNRRAKRMEGWRP